MQRGTLALFIPLTFALAQTPADQKPATLEGTVVNSVTGSPLRKVDVTLANGDISPELAAMIWPSGAPEGQFAVVSTITLAAVTDAAGRFRFDQVPAGAWRLWARKPGFADVRYPLKTHSLRLAAGQEMTHLDIRLVPYGTVSGRVLDEDGEPIRGATVSALSYRYNAGHRRLDAVDQHETNNKGEFNLARIPPGHRAMPTVTPPSRTLRPATISRSPGKTSRTGSGSIRISCRSSLRARTSGSGRRPPNRWS